MKNIRRFAVILACVAMMVSMAVVVSASASKTFFTTNSWGYQCTGRGTINGTTATATFTATEKANLQPSIPATACESLVTIRAENSHSDTLGYTEIVGGVTATVTLGQTESTIYRTYCTFTFNKTSLGGYYLYNN